MTGEMERCLSSQQERLICPEKCGPQMGLVCEMACMSCQILLKTLTGVSVVLWLLSVVLKAGILHSPNAVMLLAHLSVAALTPGLPTESAGLCLAHCTLLSKTGNSKAFKTARGAGLQVPVASGEGAVCGVEGCLMKGCTKCFPECCRKVRRSSLAQILSLSQV